MHSYRSHHRDYLIGSTVRITVFDEDGELRATGTGFFVAPGQVVTCAHVVPASAARYVVTYQGTPYGAEVLARVPDEGAEEVFAYPDVALLDVPIAEHPCVPLASNMPEPGQELYAYGCPIVEGRPIWEHITLTSEGEQRPDGTADVFLKTKSGQVRPGASGSAVIDVETGEVVGMVAQTRDAKGDLGGGLVPTATILATLAAHGIAEANRQATCDVGTLAGARRRHKWVLQLLANDLAHGDPTHWRSMVMALYDDLPEPLTVEDVALALLNLELGDLGKALSELAKACRSAEVPHRLLGNAASFAWYHGKPLVEPETATRLAAERDQPRPRAIHLPVGRPRSIDLHTARASVRGRWEAIALTSPDAETDPATGLPAQLVRNIRSQLLHAFGCVDVDDPAEIDRQWAKRGAEALAEVGPDFLFALSADIADVDLIAGLRREFPACVFALAGRTLSPALRGDPAMLLLASLNEEDEVAADERYGEIDRKIARSVR